MLAISKNGIECSIDYIRDCGPNENGAWCNVYPYDEDGECYGDYIDDFCIHPEDCPNEGVFDEWGGLTSEAEKFGTIYVGEQIYKLRY